MSANADLNSRVRVALPNSETLQESSVAKFPMKPESEFRIVTLFSEPSCLVAHEEWYKGHSVDWVFFIHTLMFVQSGRAIMEYWNPPNWDDRGETELTEGMVFLCPKGARAFWTVVSDEPFRRVVVDFPNPGFEFEAGKSIV